MPRLSVASRCSSALAVLATAGLVAASPALAADPSLDLENLSAAQLQEQLSAGSLTSVELTRAYINRIAALNRRGPGLNAVRLLNPKAMEEAKASDARRAAGNAGPLEGLPVLVKDNTDVAGLPTTAGVVALEDNVPATDAPIVAGLRGSGAVLLGKTNLSEFANFFSSGGNPNGYSSLGGQVINATDASSTASGSSSGSGVAASTGLAALTIGTETSGSIISPSAANGIVGLRPTIGLVPRSGIIPISATQDTAGPMVRTVTDAALELQAIAGKDPEDSATDGQPATLPSYTAGLKTDALQGKRIATITSTDPIYQAAVTAVQGAGATTVNIGSNPSSTTTPPGPPSVLTYEFKRDLNAYLDRVTAKGGKAGKASLADVIDFNRANPVETLKFGQGTLLNSQATDLSDPGQRADYEAKVTSSRQNAQASIDAALAGPDTTPGTADDYDAILTTSGGTTGIGARAGYPQLTVPAGFSATSRNPVNISFQGTAYTEDKLLAFGYAFEQATKARTGPAITNPSIERCAPVREPKPFAERSCMPTGEELLASIGGKAPELGFSLEAATATGLQARLANRSLSSETLTKAYLARIAAVNNAGPAINAVRSLNPDALAQAKASDQYRRTRTARPLEGLPILVKDNLDVAGLPTTGGSIALQGTVPKTDSAVVGKLKAAGAIVLGKTNMTEFDNLMASTTGSGATLASYMPAGYSSLGGYTLNPYDLSLIQGGGGPGGSTAGTSYVGNGGSAGSASAAAAGLAALTIGTETNGSIVYPSSANGVVGMRPSYGTVSRAGMLPAAKSQDTPGTIGRSVSDVAAGLQAIVGKDGDDSATAGAPTSPPDYLSGLTTGALTGKRIGVLATAPPSAGQNSTNASPNYDTAKTALTDAGATLVITTEPAPPTTASVFAYEFKRDLNAYLSSANVRSDVTSLRQVISVNTANEQEALKYNQGQLTAAQAQDTSSGSGDSAAYAADVAAGKAAAQGSVDAVLNGPDGTAGTADDLDAVVLPQDSRTQDTTYTAGARAGYPQVSVPAGYVEPSSETTPGSHDPYAVTFLGKANTDAALLGYAYAYEQAGKDLKVGSSNDTLARQVPSAINPATWRCSPDSVFGPRSCPPGDFLAAEATVGASPEAGSGAGAATGAGSGGDAAPGPSASAPSGGQSPGAVTRPARLFPRAIAIRVTPGRDPRAPFRFTTRGKLTLPAGATASRACRGRAEIRIKAGRRTISLRRVFVRRDCTFTSRVTFTKPSRFFKRGALRFTARFGGNAVLLPRAAKSVTVRVR